MLPYLCPVSSSPVCLVHTGLQVRIEKAGTWFREPSFLCTHLHPRVYCRIWHIVETKKSWVNALWFEGMKRLDVALTIILDMYHWHYRHQCLQNTKNLEESERKSALEMQAVNTVNYLSGYTSLWICFQRWTDLPYYCGCCHQSTHSSKRDHLQRAQHLSSRMPGPKEYLQGKVDSEYK